MTIHRLALLLVAVLFFACGGNEVGIGDEIDATGGPNIDADNTVVDADTALDADTMCVCDQTSCGNRTCGRSDCGFPCGTCTPNQWCALGTCTGGPGPGSTCNDAFGDPVWEGDRGFTTCPDPGGGLLACECSGGGPNAWQGCDANCIDQCPSPEQLCIEFCDAGTIICSPPWSDGLGACETNCLADLADCDVQELGVLDACLNTCSTLPGCVQAAACVGN